MRYVAAKYLFSFKTSREYAEIAVMRHGMNLPDAKLSELEIKAKSGVSSRLQQRLEREEQELRAGWGNVREVEE